MKRKTPSWSHLTGALLALLIASAVNLSCGKDAALLKPSQSAIGSKGAAAASSSTPSGDEVVLTEAVVTLAPGTTLGQSLGYSPIELVSTLELPAVGGTPAETYYLVRSVQNTPLDLTDLPHSPGSPTVTPHNRVWMPEDDRGGLPFDDEDSRRLGGDYVTQQAIFKVKLTQARQLSEGLGVTIAILDTGVETLHKIFLTGVKATFSAAGNYTTFPPTTGIADIGNTQDEDGDGKLNDGVGHGTHVAGIVYTGARKATLRIYKVLNDEGRGTAFGLAKAIKAATDANVNVINMSLGLNVDDRMIRHVIAHAVDRGIAVVASAGNLDSDELQYPAAYDGVVSVTAVDNDDVRASFASYGSTVDIAAPGVDVVSAIPNYFGPEKYAIASGSSMATPWVSAAIACVQSRSGSLEATDAIPSVLIGAADVSTHNPLYTSQLGAGRVDFHRALMVPIMVE